MGLRSINIDNTPLSDKIAETIKNRILKGIIKPGERLIEPKLAEQMGISRTPVREALRQLESEGFIEIIPRRGAVVTDVTMQDVDDIFIIRLRLESLAARLAVSRLTDEDIEKMKLLAAKVKDLKSGSRIQLNSEFHDIFILNCGNERLIKLISELQQQFKRAATVSLAETARREEIVREHMEIAIAFENRDEDLAEKLAGDHIRKSWEFIKSRM